jgi:glutamine amidotransferase
VTVALIDYGAGNLASVTKALVAAGATVNRVTGPAAIEEARAIVVPGVGHFGATAALDARWRAAIERRLAAGASLLGICLGMQWLYQGSLEAPEVPGLGIVGGRCARLTGDVKVPHVGWNSLDAVDPRSRLLAGVAPGTFMYFTHAYAAPAARDAAALTTHGGVFTSAVERGRVFGIQCHPEKSGAAGVRVLANFLEAAC